MRYLLDVNALVALGFLQHEFHEEVAKWANSIAAGGVPDLVTCSITELGFVRVLAQAPQYGLSISQARTLLLQMKTENILNSTLIADSHGVAQLPGWVKTAKQTTDGHLVQLAKANGAVLATLDTRIRGAFVIPPIN
jgi:uncharacterized protein